MKTMQRLVEIMAQLRARDTGCPWDVEQTFASIAPYTIEEAYEVADAIERDDMTDLRDELGDLLFQVVFHSQMASEAGHFNLVDVTRGICAKMTRRHPHVFGDSQVHSAAAQSSAWETLKAAERRQQGQHSALDGIARGLPEWQRAAKLHRRAARVGFDWPNPAAVLDKVDEELDELKVAIEGDSESAVEEEFGDLMFAMLALAKHLDVDAGKALRAANRKFERRFRAVEALAGSQDLNLAELNASQLDELWETVKRGDDVAG